MRWLRRILIALVVLAVVVGLAGVWLVRRSFPRVDGAVTVDGLDEAVTVTRDSDGIPHIEAATSRDLFFAQGYVHAQDRFWQMDVWRHIGAGRLSEMFGDSQIDTDSFLRTLGFERIAAEEYQLAPPAVKLALDSYADGVNAYLAERPGASRLSLEYVVLSVQNSYTPPRWDPVDSLTWGHVMAWDLRSNVEEELDRAILAGTIGRERTEQLYPPYPSGHPVIVSGGGQPAAASESIEPSQALAALQRTSANLAPAAALLGGWFEGIGSNSWVVDGSRTASGAPLLANDPHLGIQMPSIWHEVDLWCREVNDACPYRVAGFSFPGAPGVVIGHNQRIAWGVTNLGPDTMDLYIERTDGEGRFEIEGEFVPFDVRTETISVAGGADVTLAIRSTRHGPVISGRYGPVDELERGGTELPDDYAISLRWQALEPSTLFESLLSINVASNWAEFREAASLFDIAAQNLVYADVDGHIGYQATGEIPVRRNGTGRYPVPGWTGEHEWTGFIDFDDLPSRLDPPSGMIVTANQPVVDSSDAGFIGADHAYGYRAARITELLEASNQLEAEDMIDIQMDTFDASAARVVPAVLELAPTAGVTTIQEVLRPWAEDGFQMAADSSGAAAYAAVWRHLLAATFDDELTGERRAGGNSRYFAVVDRLLHAPADPWWDDAATDEKETAAATLASAVRLAHAELTDRLGEDPNEWRWGDLHRAEFVNETLGRSGIAVIEALFNRAAPKEVAGGSAILNATGWYAPDGYAVVAVPSMRMVVDLGDFDRSRSIHTTGQSGHAFSSHYFDMVDRWATGGTHPMRFGPDSVTAPEGVLTLLPPS